MFLIYQNDSLWLLSLLRFLTFFPPKTGGRLKIVLPSFPAWDARTYGFFSSHFFWSSSSHTSSMGFKSAYCADQEISWKACFSFFFFFFFLLLMYLWKSLQACFGSLSCISKILDPRAAFQIASSDAAVYFDSRSDLICPSLGANPWLYKWQNPPSHTITECPPCITVGVIQGVRCSFDNSSPHIYPPIWAKYFELRFFGLKNFTPQFYCSVFVHLGPV